MFREMVEKQLHTLSSWLSETDFLINNIIEVDHNNLQDNVKQTLTIIQAYEEKLPFLKAIQEKVASRIEDETNCEPMSIAVQYKNVEKTYKVRFL